MIKNKEIIDDSKMKNKAIFLITVIVLIGGFLILELVSPLREAIILATNIKPETFTELYFEDHVTLPSKVDINKEINFKFTIHNLENKDMEYRYEVFIDIEGKKQIIDQNVILIKNNEYKTTLEEFSLREPIKNRAKVVINLVNKNQQVHFWVEGEENLQNNQSINNQT